MGFKEDILRTNADNVFMIGGNNTHKCFAYMKAEKYHKIIDAIDNVSEEQIQEYARMHRECVDKLVKGGFARMEMQHRKLLSELKIEIPNTEEDDK